jgi:hypothetical protein
VTTAIVALVAGMVVFLAIFLALSWRQGRVQPHARDVVEPRTGRGGAARDAAGEPVAREAARDGTPRSQG